MSSKPHPPNPRIAPCHRHRHIPITSALCASCLRHRLSLLNPDLSLTSTTSSAALRRCNTFSANNLDRNTERDTTRRSCDVRPRNSLDGEEDCGTNFDFEVPRVSDLPISDEFGESKTMKEFIDLEIQANTNPNPNSRRDFKEVASSFWVGASVFSKKLQKWRKKQGSSREQAKCNADPRVSIDLGRASIDCGRISVEEARSSFNAPRASLDGCLMGGRKIPRGNTPMVSVIENAMATVYGFDHRMLAGGRMKLKSKDEKGFDGTEAIPLSNSRVSASAIGIFNGNKLLITEKELNEWRLNSLKNVDVDVDDHVDVDDDDSSQAFETASKDLAYISSGCTSKDFKKRGKPWGIWGVLHRRKGDKYDNGKCTNANPANNTARKNESKAIVRRKQEEEVVDRNQSLRHTPNDLDNGLLRFNPTPLRRSKLAESRLKKSHSP